MNLQFDHDTIGLADAVAAARCALIPRLQGLDADLATIEEIRALNAPFSDPALRSGNGLRRALKGAVSVQKNRWFWREQRAMELAAGLWRRMALRGATDARCTRGALLFVVPYDIVDAATGGASRLYGLARELAATHEVRLLSLVGPNRDPDAIGLYPGVTLYVVPRTAAFERHVAAEASKYGDAAALLGLASGGEHLPLLSYWIATLGHDADVVFVDGPPLCEMVRRELPNKHLVYESPNAYRRFVRVIAGEGTPMADAATREAGRLEAMLCRETRLAVCVSEEDRAFLARENGVPDERTLVAPNGVSTRHSLVFTPSATRRLKEFAGLRSRIALFVGSCHKPNIDAVDFIANRLAPSVRDTHFVVMGMGAHEFTRGASIELPRNLTFTGKLSTTDKEVLFALADVALCPVITGSGSSLKIPDYAAHGKPVISTAFGLRGFDALRPFVNMAELDLFAEALAQLAATETSILEERCVQARRVVEAEYDWTRIADGLRRGIEPLLRGAR